MKEAAHNLDYLNDFKEALAKWEDHECFLLDDQFNAKALQEAQKIFILQ